MITDPDPTREPVVITPGGHGPEVWAALVAAAPRVPLADLAAALTPLGGRAGVTELVVVAAHPDDETLGLGRLVSAWGRSVGSVTGVLATAGEACVDHVMERPPGIAGRRIAEWHTALDRLGVTGRRVLDLPDAQLSEHETALTQALAAVVADLEADGRTVVLAAPWRADPHPDHRAAGRAAATVAAASSLPLVEFGVWMSFWAEPTSVREQGQVLLVIPHDEDTEQAFQGACRAFTSQLQPLTAYATPVVPPGMLALLCRQLLIVAPGLAAAVDPPGALE